MMDDTFEKLEELRETADYEEISEFVSTLSEKECYTCLTHISQGCIYEEEYDFETCQDNCSDPIGMHLVEKALFYSE